MATVAEHVNEMQRVHEEFGAAFDELSRLYRQHRSQLLGLSLAAAAGAKGSPRGPRPGPHTPPPGASQQVSVSPAIELSVGDMLMYGAVDWLNAHEYELCALRDGARLAAVVFVFRSALVIFAMERGADPQSSSCSGGEEAASTQKLKPTKGALQDRKKSPGTAAKGAAAGKANGNRGRRATATGATGSLGNLNDARLFSIAQNGNGDCAVASGLRDLKNASVSSELVAKSASRVSLMASSMRFQTVVPVSELQVAACDALSTPERFVWQVVHRRPAIANSQQPADVHQLRAVAPNNRPLERVYLLANATAAVREQFLRVIAHTLEVGATEQCASKRPPDSLQQSSNSTPDALYVESCADGGVGATNGFVHTAGTSPLWRCRELANKSK